MSYSRMGTDPVLAALKFHWCRELDWDETAVKNSFVSSDAPTGKV